MTTTFRFEANIKVEDKLLKAVFKADNDVYLSEESDLVVLEAWDKGDDMDYIYNALCDSEWDAMNALQADELCESLEDLD